MWLSLLACSGDGRTIGLGVDTVPDNVLAKRIDIRRRTGGSAVLRCEGVGVDDEVHEVPLPAAPEGAEEVLLAGLLADTTYRCTVPGADAETLEFTTSPLPDDLPATSLVEERRAGGAYLLLNHGTDDREDRETKILVFDAEGRLRWYYWVPFNAPDLDVSLLDDQQFLYGGGYAALPTIIDLEGRVAMQAPGPYEPSGSYNHTVERLADGSFLTTETSRNHDPANPGNQWNGFVIEVLNPTMHGRAWSLHSQDLVESGDLPVAASPEDNDPYHLNALQWFADEGQVVASLYRRAEILWLDVESEQLLDRFGWRSDWELVDERGDALPASEWFYGQHAVEIAGDRVLLHDNGMGRPSATKYTRAVEYTLDHATRTARVSWSWTQPGWYEPIWGDVDRLADGRVSITHAHCEKCSSVTGQRTEIIVVDPTTNEVDWRLRFGSPHDAGYRSEWIDGCDLFHRVSTCE
jgi:hypothetical protein